jgi:hypothetical protein
VHLALRDKPVPLANMRSRGRNRVFVYCSNPGCHHNAELDVSRLPGIEARCRVIAGSLSGPQQRILNSLAPGKRPGLIEYPSPDHVAITDVGEAQSIPIELQSSLLDFVVANLPGPEGRILKAIAAHYPNAVPNEPGRGRSSA